MQCLEAIKDSRKKGKKKITGRKRTETLQRREQAKTWEEKGKKTEGRCPPTVRGHPASQKRRTKNNFKEQGIRLGKKYHESVAPKGTKQPNGCPLM